MTLVQHSAPPGSGRAYAGQSAGERDAQRRERLLAAAVELIGNQGYPATTIPGVCAAAKVSTRHFYRLYSTKEDLFVDVYDRLTGESYTRVTASLRKSTDRPIRERIPSALLAYLGPMLEDARVARIAFVEVMGASARIERVRLDYRETLVTLVEREVRAAVERAEIADRDWRFATLALVGAATAIVYDWMLRTGGDGVEHIEAALAELAVQLLTADTTRGGT
ncbi:MAG TPA: TetR/AcrR family transcriptional regulator [Jatrophihabitantaceae bacterium]|jgi:AcrR family transcriptional regulator